MARKPGRPVDAKVRTWAQGTPLVRVHGANHSATSFNPTDAPGRFRPIYMPGGEVVPTLYAADALEGALAESVLRNVPLDGPDRRVNVDRLVSLSVSEIHAERALRLAILYDPEVKRLRVSASELTQGRPDTYSWTASWAEAIHDDMEVDGLIWVPRHHNRALALMLFGDRLAEGELVADGEPQSLVTGLVRHDLLAFLERADIALIEG